MVEADTVKEEVTNEEDTKRKNPSLLYKFPWISFKFLLAFHTTEIIRFPFIRDLKFRCLFVQNHAAHTVRRHYITLHYTHTAVCLLSLVVLEFSGLFKRRP